MGKPGPKPRQWTDQERGMVRGMAIGGVPQARIAEYLSTSAKSLREEFRKELDYGMDEMKALAVSSVAFHLRQKHPAMTMFFMKTQCGWRETTAIEHSGNITPVVNFNPKVVPPIHEHDDGEDSPDIH